MKKLFVFLFSLILSAVFSTSASAYDVKVDGIYYNLISEDKTAEVTYGVEKYSGEVVIPGSITSEGKEYKVKRIGERAFSDCSGLTSITIPNSVTSIGEKAFGYCTGLTSITIPNSVTSIEKGAFSDCKGLTSVDIPNSVTSIGQSAFSYCSGLTSITIPNSVTSIGNSAFYSCSSLTSVTIPNSVTSIGRSAFSSCSGLTSITIPNSVTSIGDCALYGCSGLKDVIIVNNMFVHLPVTYSGHYSIPENISQIIGGAFSGCSGLTSITIPNSVTSIGESAFYACSGLTSITIPNSVKSIGTAAFLNCSGLTSVTVPNSVTSIGDCAFQYCSGLTSVTIPNSVTSIGKSAFYGCSGLTSITIPNSVTSIEQGAFRNCSGLKSVTIPNSVTSIGSWAFYGCKGLTSVDIPNSVESIGDCALMGCSGLKDVIIVNNMFVHLPETYSWHYSIPETISQIIGGAFYNCKGLILVTIPNSVTSIGEYAFYNCIELENVYCYAEKVPSTDATAFENSSIESSTLHVPGSALSLYQTTVPWSGFGTILPIEPLDITVDTDTKEATVETAKFVEDGNVVIPASIEVDGETYTVTSIANEAFKDVEDVETVTLPRTLKEIGKGAFSGCKALKEVVVSETATNSKVSAVRYGKIQRVATRAAGDGMRIGERAFADCPVLASVTIPSTATTIGDNVFNNCESLKNVTCEAVNCPTVKTFGEFPISEATLTVPVGSLKQYGETNPWSLFGKIQDFDGTTGVNGISVYDRNDVKDVYGIDGSKRAVPAKGLNIIRMSDGTTRKVMR